MASKLDKLAREYAEPKKFDPLTVISIILAVIQVVQKCRESSLSWPEIVQAGRTRLATRRCRRAAREAVGSVQYESVGGDDCVAWVLERGVRLEQDEYEALAAESKG